MSPPKKKTNTFAPGGGVEYVPTADPATAILKGTIPFLDAPSVY